MIDHEHLLRNDIQCRGDDLPDANQPVEASLLLLGQVVVLAYAWQIGGQRRAAAALAIVRSNVGSWDLRRRWRNRQILGEEQRLSGESLGSRAEGHLPQLAQLLAQRFECRGVLLPLLNDDGDQRVNIAR